MMSLRLLLLITPAILVGGISCTGRPADGAVESKPLPSDSSSGEAYFLDAHDLAEMKEKAMSGDIDAAFSVANHYAFAELDLQESVRWNEVAANHGDLRSMSNAIVGYVSLGGRANCRRALFWYEQLASQPVDKISKATSETVNGTTIDWTRSDYLGDCQAYYADD